MTGMMIHLVDRGRQDQGSTIAEVGAGLVCALYILIGAWSPGRLSGLYDQPLSMQPRFWLAAMLLFISAGTSHRWRRQRVSSAHTSERSWFIALTVVSLAYTSATALWAPEGEPAMRKLQEVLIVGMAFAGVALASEVAPRRKIADLMWNTVCVLTFALAVLALPASLAGGRVAVMGGGPNVFARLMGLMFIIGVHGLAVGRYKGLWLVLMLVAAMFVVLSGSRGAMLALAVTGGFALLFYRIPMRRIAVAALAGMSAASLAYWFTPLGGLARTMFEERVLLLTVERLYASQRDLIYALAWDLGVQNVLFGKGLAGFHATYPFFAHPHNIFLEAFAEGGFFGVFFLAGALGFALRLVLAKDVAGDHRIPLAFIMLLIASQFSGDFYDARALLILPLLAAGGDLNR